MKKEKSLSENIAKLFNSVPQNFDEDDDIDGTSAKVFTPDSEDSDHGEINERSKIRASNIDLLEDVDEKYAGKLTSRKRYRDSDDEGDSEEGSDDNGVFDENIICAEEEETDENDCNEENEIEEGSDVSYGSDVESNDDENFKNFSESTTVGKGNKGISVRKQLNIWESLLEMRIKSKKALSASNKMPVGGKLKEIFKCADEESKNKLSQTNRNLTNLLKKMLLLETLMLKKYPETRKLSLKKQENNQQDNEEISSEEELDDEQEIKRSKIQNYGEELSERHEVYRIYRNKTIEKWYDKTKFKHTQSNSYTIVDQINNILMDKSKLLKKTQLKRSSGQIIGEAEGKDEADYDVNIYDDEDFYHQQLRELVEFKSSDIIDPIQLSRQWVQLQNMRSTMKRKIDTRATKGRKVRFGIHSKLVNHVGCRDFENSKTDDAINELESSMFQKKIK